MNRRTMHPGGVLTLLAVAVILAALASLMTGSVLLPPGDVAQILLDAEHPGSPPSWRAIVWSFRLPKTLTAILAGAALATAGLLMQTLFRNPLAGPYVLGLSAGASLAVALVVLGAGAGGLQLLSGLGAVGDVGVAAAASFGAGAVLMLVLMAARRVASLTLLILGVLFGYATGALVTILLHFSVADRVQAYVIWTFGSFGGVTWRQLAVLAGAVVVGLAIAWLVAKPLDALLLGETYASSLGVDIRSARGAVLVATALLAGSVTAFCGPVGFVGVAVPHMARAMVATARHRWLVPATALSGSLVALLADLVAQLPGTAQVLPLNAVTALLGAPVIAWIVLRRRGLEDTFQ